MKKKKGQAIMEIALVLPFLLIVFCGITDFGRILYTSTHLNMITQEAVRLAGLGKSDYEITNYVNEKVYIANPEAVNVDINPKESYRDSGDYVTVKITYDVNYITPLIGKILPSPFKVNTQSTIRVE